MTDPKPTPDPDRPPDASEHHGIVEELKHEIEEVIEHVPQPVRWTVRKLVLFSLLALVGLVVVLITSVILYYANRTELAAKELTLVLNRTLTSRSNVRIEVSDIRGNPLRRVRLVNPRVVFSEGGPPLLEAPSIDLSYSALSLLRNDASGIELSVEKPAIRVVRNPDGTLRLPVWRTSGKTAGKPRSFGVHLRLHDGSLQLPVQSGRVQGLDLDALVSTGPQSHALVRSLKWRDGPFQTRDLQLVGEVSSGDSVRIEIRRLQTADLTLSARGEWQKGSRVHVAHIDVQRLRWRWLARATHNNAFDVPGEAAARVDAVKDSTWTGRFTSELSWNGLPMTGSGAFTWINGRLRAEPLQARSAAGNLAGVATWSRAEWSVGGLVTSGEPSRWDAIGIPGWPKGDLNGRFAYLVDTRQHVSNGSLVALAVRSELQGWRVDSCRVRASLPAHGTRTFDVDAVRRGGRFTLHGVANQAGWTGEYRVAGLPLDEWPDGRASGIRGQLDAAAGTVTVEHGHMAVTGDLSGRQTDWFGMHAARWTLRDATGALLPAPDLTSAVTLHDVSFLGVHFDSVASPIHLGDKSLDLVATRAWAADTSVTLAGRADWTGSTWALGLDRLGVASRHFAWTATPPVRLTGDATGVTFHRLEVRDSNAVVVMNGRWAAPGGSYDWEAQARGLDLSRLGMPDAWGLGGTTDGTLRVQGISGDPRWSFEGAARAPAYGGHRGDSLAIVADGSKALVNLRHGEFRIGGGTLEARGRLSGMATPWPDTLVGTAIARWLVSASEAVGDAHLREFPIERATDLSPSSHGWSGRLTADATLAGSLDRPRLDVTASVTPLTWRDFSMEHLDLAARYQDELLTITRLRATRDQLGSSAEGTIPIRLSLRRGSELLDQPMDIAVDVKNGDLRLLPRLLPQIGSAAGRLDASARIAGTAKHPDLTGAAHVAGASLRLAGRSEVLEDVRAELRMRQSQITLDTLVAREGERGRVRAHGTVTLEGLTPNSYRIELAMREFTAQEPGIYAVQFDGDFVVTEGQKVRGQSLPFVTGNANLLRGVVLLDFANQTESEQLAASNVPLYWLYRINLTATSNLRWQPPDGDIELNADLTAEQTPTELRLFGEMHTLRGYYYFLSNRFTVEQGDLTFDNVSGVNPTIDAQATTHVTGEGLAPHDITVTITGRAREPAIAFSSSPSDWDENDILRELTVGRFVARGVAQGDPFDNYLTRAINRTLSAEMSQAFKGYVNEWVIDREQGGLFGGQGEVIVGVGSQVTRNLMLRYRQRVPGLGRETVATTASGATPFERDLEAEYRLNRFFIVTSELTQRRSLTGNVTTTSAAPDFNINLKARWEY